MIAADLLRSMLAAEYQSEVRDGRLAIASPTGTILSPLRERVTEHRDELKVLLNSDNPFASCTRCDEVLLEEEARRLDADHLKALVTAYLDRYALTADAVDVEIASWFGAALEAQHHGTSYELDAAGGCGPNSALNGLEQSGMVVIWVCAACGLPRSRRPEPCPACGALDGRNRYPLEEVA